ncbi:MAG: alpha/beta hydrolase, partial [Chloroflexaceae bacterium]|nr:alpha/beta hydrolase [Chloroflexaceae bacterium]
MTTYTVNGQRIYAREEGQEGRQVALLIHGWSSSWYALSPLIPLLSKRFRVVAVDLPGYGNSPALPRRVTMDAYADLLADMAQQITDGPVVLIGHSMGGMISLTIALRHPVLVERMVLVCPTISGHLSTYINWMVSPVTVLENFSPVGQLLGMVEPYIVGVTDRIMRPASFAERTSITGRRPTAACGPMARRGGQAGYV